MNIDLTKYVIGSGSWGPWLQDKDAFTAGELRLGDPTDGVTLAGPLRICVAIQARNQFTLFGSSTLALQTRDVYSYTLDIPPGQTWTYPAPAALGTSSGLHTNADSRVARDAVGSQRGLRHRHPRRRCRPVRSVPSRSLPSVRRLGIAIAHVQLRWRVRRRLRMRLSSTPGRPAV